MSSDLSGSEDIFLHLGERAETVNSRLRLKPK